MTTKLLFAFLILSMGTTWGPDVRAADAFAEAYAAAETALAGAEARRNVWSKTEAILRRSKAAYDAGRTDEAIELATEAKLQAELALAQAESGQEAWKENVLSE